MDLSDSIDSKKTLWVFSRRVILHTCSIGFKSGEYGGRRINSTLSRISEYSSSFSVTIRRYIFLCHGALSITIAYFLSLGAGESFRNARTDAIEVR